MRSRSLLDHARQGSHLQRYVPLLADLTWAPPHFSLIERMALEESASNTFPLVEEMCQ